MISTNATKQPEKPTQKPGFDHLLEQKLTPA